MAIFQKDYILSPSNVFLLQYRDGLWTWCEFVLQIQDLVQNAGKYIAQPTPWGHILKISTRSVPDTDASCAEPWQSQEIPFIPTCPGNTEGSARRTCPSFRCRHRSIRIWPAGLLIISWKCFLKAQASCRISF